VIQMDDQEEKVCKSIQHNFHKAWCDLMREKIVAKDWDMFEVCLQEIIDRLKAFVHNRTSIHEQIDREIPVGLILQMLRNDAVIPSDFLQYFGAILQWLQKLGPPDMDDVVDAMQNRLQELSPTDYISTMPDTILAINIHLDAVKLRIDKFKDELSSNIANGDDTK